MQYKPKGWGLYKWAASFGASVNFETVDIQQKPMHRYRRHRFIRTYKQNISAGTGIIDSAWYVGVRLSNLDSKGQCIAVFSSQIGTCYRNLF